MATAAQLKALRKKYGLGEFSRSSPRGKKVAKKRTARKSKKRSKSSGQSKFGIENIDTFPSGKYTGSREKDLFLGSVNDPGYLGWLERRRSFVSK